MSHGQQTSATRFSAADSELWIVGGGIAGMSVAAFAIRDAGVPGKNIHILEETGITGGSMDGAHAPNNPHQAWVTRGGRMLTDETYLCTWDLFDTIPSLEDPAVSVREDVRRFNERVKTEAKARLIDKNHQNDRRLQTRLVHAQPPGDDASSGHQRRPCGQQAD